MKKIIAIGMAVGILCLSACVSKPEETTPVTTAMVTTKQTTETPTEATTQETEPTVPETSPVPVEPILFEKNGITMVYVSHEVGEDRDGNPALVVSFDYTNVAEKQNPPGWQFEAHGYQNGVEQKRGDPVYKDGKSLSTGAQWMEYTPGTTISYTFTFTLTDLTTDFVLEVNDNIFDESQGEKKSMLLKLS